MEISRTEPYIHHGLIVTAVTAWALLLVINVASIIITNGNMPILGFVFGYFMYGLTCAYLFTVILGYPLWKIARRYKFDTRRNAVIIGIFAGGIASGVNFFIFLQGKATVLHLLDFAVTITVGGFAAWVGYKKAYKFMDATTNP